MFYIENNERKGWRVNQNLVILVDIVREFVFFVREDRGLLESVSRELMGFLDFGSSGKKVFEDNKIIIIKISLKIVKVVCVRNYGSLNQIEVVV